MVALKTPVMQAEYVVDDATAFSLYDSLIPKLREHRKFRIPMGKQNFIEDFKSQMQVRQMEQDLEQRKLPEKSFECEMLKCKLRQFEKEAELVKWYINIMEEGIDTKEIVTKFKQLKDEFTEYKSEKELEIPQLQKEIEKLENDNLKV